MKRTCFGAVVAAATLAIGCSNSSSSPSDTAATTTTPASSSAGAHAPAATGGSAAPVQTPHAGAGSGAVTNPVSGSAGHAGASSTTSQPSAAGGGAGTGAAGAAGAMMAAAGMNAAGGSAAGSSAGAAGATASGSAGNITGTLGALGPVQPILSGWATTNGLETLIYLATAPLTCEMMMTKGTKWLSTLPAKSQVMEIVVGTPSAVKSYTIGMPAAFGGGEVNYAEGSKSSSTEVTGSAGTITLTKAEAKGVQEGMISVTAPFMASGMFHAEWCEGGTEY